MRHFLGFVHGVVLSSSWWAYAMWPELGKSAFVILIGLSTAVTVALTILAVMSVYGND